MEIQIKEGAKDCYFVIVKNKVLGYEREYYAISKECAEKLVKQLWQEQEKKMEKIPTLEKYWAQFGKEI